MGELLGKIRRTHYAGELRNTNIGENIVLMGWVSKRRNLGSIIFVDLRDRSGISQVVFDENFDKSAFDKADALRNEFVIAVSGVVRERHSKNPNIPTGDIEVYCNELKILSEAQVPPIHIDDNDDANERIRLTYRYLDLRKPRLQNILKLRHKLSLTIHNVMDERGFISVETPILTKPTPEGARDYLVPSRVSPGDFYALPQSPQQFKQILMIGGLDRYYQLAKCFRDEDLRADRQPEFTQLDIEMSFADQEDVMREAEYVASRIFKEIRDYDIKLPLPRLSYDEAIARYGSDKPDTRFGFELRDLTDILKNTQFSIYKGIIENNGVIKAINVDGYGSEFSRKEITKLEEVAKSSGAKALAYIKLTSEGISSSLSKALSEDEINEIIARMEAKEGDLILISADSLKVVSNTLSNLRNTIARKLGLVDPNVFNLLWVDSMPLYEYNEEEGRLIAAHHPFTMVKDEHIELMKTNPSECRAKAYDLVCNGYELAGGSIRIHNQQVQELMFRTVGFSDELMKERFGYFIDAFKYGTPPHGGIAFGFDRLVMLLAGTENIKDVVAFPKTQDAKCLMTGAPGFAEDKQLDELHIKRTVEGKCLDKE